METTTNRFGHQWRVGDSASDARPLRRAGNLQSHAKRLDANHKPLAIAKPITRNVTGTAVSFERKDALTEVRGQRVRLKFELERAKLYSFALGQ